MILWCSWHGISMCMLRYLWMESVRGPGSGGLKAKQLHSYSIEFTGSGWCCQRPYELLKRQLWSLSEYWLPTGAQRLIGEMQIPVRKVMLREKPWVRRSRVQILVSAKYFFSLNVNCGIFTLNNVTYVKCFNCFNCLSCRVGSCA